MRILQVVHAFPPREWAGTELVTLHLAQALLARGHQVTVLTRSGDPGAEEFSVREEYLDGLEIVRVVNNYSRMTTFRSSYDNPFFDDLLTRLLDQLRPDVVHFQHLIHLSVRLLSVAAALGYPVVLTLHDFFFACHRVQRIDAHDRLCPGPERGERCVPCLHEFATPEEARHRFTHMERALHVPDVILTPSIFLAEKIREYFPEVEEKIRAVSLGVKPVANVSRKRRAGTPLRLLYIGVLSPHKGAHVLIEALQGLPPEAVEASLYGVTVAERASYAAALREEARGLSVQFHDAYPYDQLTSILSQHDVLVMPMVWEETFSLLTREAFMAGLPVVAARRGALAEAVHDGVNGLLFEPENAADLRRCLTRFLVEPDLLERLRAVPARVKTVEEYAADIEGVYAEVCAEPHRVHTLRQRLTTQQLASTMLEQETTPLRSQLQDLRGRYATLHEQRDDLSKQRAVAEQARDDALAEVRVLQESLKTRESQLQERGARLEAIYASTTWKLYRGYAALRHWLRFALRELQRAVCALRK